MTTTLLRSLPAATLAMIETAQAMENLEEIVQVDGLDGVFIGGSVAWGGVQMQGSLCGWVWWDGVYVHGSRRFTPTASLFMERHPTGPNDLALALGMAPTSDPTEPAILAVIER